VLRLAPPPPSGLTFGDRQGYVVLELTVDSDGRIVSIQRLEASLPDEHLDAIEELARTALFDPARRGNHPVSGNTFIRFEYHPAEPEPLQYQWIPDYQPDAG
jgi:outer membrane biosynthesis protein TonB